MFFYCVVSISFYIVFGTEKQSILKIKHILHKKLYSGFCSLLLPKCSGSVSETKTSYNCGTIKDIIWKKDLLKPFCEKNPLFFHTHLLSHIVSSYHLIGSYHPSWGSARNHATPFEDHLFIM